MSRPRYYGSGSSAAGFRGIGSHLLRPAGPRAGSGSESHGPYLVVPIRTDQTGGRVAACPVCLAPSVLPRSAGGWVVVRCDSCGTEYCASDGTAPPAADPPRPPAPQAPPLPPRKPSEREVLRRNIERWVASGQPDRWVELREGSTSGMDGLVEALRFSNFWPLDPADVRRVLEEAARRYRARKAVPPPPAPAVVRVEDGTVHAPCPHCRGFAVAIPATPGAVLTCPGCGGKFVVASSPKPRPKPPPPPPPASFWDKLRKWFGG